MTTSKKVTTSKIDQGTAASRENGAEMKTDSDKLKYAWTEDGRPVPIHDPGSGESKRYLAVRLAAEAFAEAIVKMTPVRHEQAIALTHVEQASFWASAAITHGEDE